jgi:AraC-like DNA-binding protein
MRPDVAWMRPPPPGATPVAAVAGLGPYTIHGRSGVRHTRSSTMCDMVDAFTGLLDGPRARDAFLLRCLMAPPWSLHIADESPLALVAVVRGEAWLVPAKGAAIRVRDGGVAVIRGPEPYTLAGDPATAPRVLIEPGQRCTTLRGQPLHEKMNLGVRTWGNSPNGRTSLLIGVYQRPSEISASLLDALPEMLALPADAWDCPLISLLADEIGRDELGQSVVLNRLLDLLLVSVLRAWLGRSSAATPAWYRAQSDPIVGPAIRMMHNDPAHGWTVASLGSACGVSRAAFARRFTELIGQPPMTFLTELRLTLAADLLRDPAAKVGAIAQQVGYGSPFALSSAFKRVRGVSPRDYRLTAAS